ncbi:hypothetical protein CTheo_4832 [Ceratobasidium theobromae]|uniref:Serine/threonine-protein phosphatase 2A activator n=1 Tax=Ceratobasidium theobromae TaxID=1582974 RepID=A0A5N5QJQ1_9AGAM|nr:hypothetical protein CTheo_4832 [Ceratobasidium theobromae]
MIQTDNDVHAWQRSESYAHLLLYIHRLGEAVVGTELRNSPIDTRIEESVRSVLTLLEQIVAWVDDIPPQSCPQRYGNLAFRDWGKRLEEQCESLLKSMLPESLHKAIPFLQPYLLTSFGSFIRIDYGTGHELSFVVFLLCLHKIGFLTNDLEVERSTVLDVFIQYLHVCWRLQDIYKLEPAGSHGVWGLDDYSFLGYYWGSAQLRGMRPRSTQCLAYLPPLAPEKPNTTPSSVLQTPLPSPPSDLYTLSIMRVKAIKSGPFHEHSPQLYSIASSVPFWKKVNSGLMKMYEAEVLSKRVVVQHLPLGSQLMPFNKVSHPQPTSAIAQAAPYSCTVPTTATRIPNVSMAPTSLLPPLRPGVRPSTNVTPGQTSPFAASSGGARFTVSRAASRGNIPGMMGPREVAAPLASMGPPPIPVKLDGSRDQNWTEVEADVESGSPEHENQEKQG